MLFISTPPACSIAPVPILMFLLESEPRLVARMPVSWEPSTAGSLALASS